MPLNQPKDITILADVVDNYGDIGVSWRLCRHLLSKGLHYTEPDSSINIRLVTNNLKAFHNINDQIIPDVPYQKCKCGDGTIHVYDWTNYDFCYKTFTDNPPEIILEMFQCGQPDWLEKILFEDRVNYKVHIIMIDYLSAEPWVDDFHCLKSLTRTALVPKVNFMPGFTKKTGGLLLNENFTEQKNSDCTRTLFFAYPSDWTPVIRAMNKTFSSNTILKIAGGAGQESIIKACKKETTVFKTETLSYMNQSDWDLMMQNMDFMIIRGEDSMAQACVLGTPFIWQAYPQNENYHMVKVQALLERMKPHFGNEFSFVEEAWSATNSQETNRLETTIYNFLNNINILKPGFVAFAKFLRENGDLSVNLMTFIEKNIKIEKY